MRPISSSIIEVRDEAPRVRSFLFDPSLDPAPGQYAMVWVRGVDEIPMSFSGENSITVSSVGDATEALFQLGVGRSIGLRGPLGNGFVLRGDKILLVGGGVGVAPLAFLGEQARGAGIDVTALLGFRSAQDIIFLARFQRIGDTLITTDDGSLGIAGRASEGLKELELSEFSQIYLCGPEMMMQDIISKSSGMDAKIQACINRYFKCAIGICGSCCLDPEGIRICIEGPVITADRLIGSEFGSYRRGSSGAKGLCRG